MRHLAAGLAGVGLVAVGLAGVPRKGVRRAVAVIEAALRGLVRRAVARCREAAARSGARRGVAVPLRGRRPTHSRRQEPSSAVAPAVQLPTVALQIVQLRSGHLETVGALAGRHPAGQCRFQQKHGLQAMQRPQRAQRPQTTQWPQKIHEPPERRWFPEERRVRAANRRRLGQAGPPATAERVVLGGCRPSRYILAMSKFGHDVTTGRVAVRNRKSEIAVVVIHPIAPP